MLVRIVSLSPEGTRRIGRQGLNRLRDLVTDAAHCVRLGDNVISGPAEGAAAVATNAQLIAGNRLNFELKNVLMSRTDLALGPPTAARRHGRALDEHATSVCRARAGAIRSIETFLPGGDGRHAFFV